jgi:hypothetical protein
VAEEHLGQGELARAQVDRLVAELDLAGAEVEGGVAGPEHRPTVPPLARMGPRW